MSVSCKFPDATVESITHKKGALRIVITAPHEDSDATVADLNELSGGLFKGTVTIKGRATQASLDFDTGRPGKPEVKD